MSQLWYILLESAATADVIWYLLVCCLQVEGEDTENMDMYTRVKRARRKLKRDIYGMPIVEEEGKSTEDEETEQDNTGTDDSDDDDDEEGEGEEEVLQTSDKYIVSLWLLH